MPFLFIYFFFIFILLLSKSFIWLTLFVKIGKKTKKRHGDLFCLVLYVNGVAGFWVFF